MPPQRPARRWRECAGVETRGAPSKLVLDIRTGCSAPQQSVRARARHHIRRKEWRLCPPHIAISESAGQARQTKNAVRLDSPLLFLRNKTLESACLRGLLGLERGRLDRRSDSGHGVRHREDAGRESSFALRGQSFVCLHMRNGWRRSRHPLDVHIQTYIVLCTFIPCRTRPKPCDCAVVGGEAPRSPDRRRSRAITAFAPPAPPARAAKPRGSARLAPTAAPPRRAPCGRPCDSSRGILAYASTSHRMARAQTHSTVGICTHGVRGHHRRCLTEARASARLTGDDDRADTGYSSSHTHTHIYMRHGGDIRGRLAEQQGRAKGKRRAHVIPQAGRLSQPAPATFQPLCGRSCGERWSVTMPACVDDIGVGTVMLCAEAGCSERWGCRSTPTTQK